MSDLLKDNVWEILRAYTCQETNMSIRFIRRMISKLFKAWDCKGVSSNHHTRSDKEESTVSAEEKKQSCQDDTHGKVLIFIFMYIFSLAL